MQIIIWTLITLFIYLFVNKLYLYIKQSNIKEGMKENISNNDKQQIKNNANNLAQINKKVIEIKNLINDSKNIQNKSQEKFKKNKKALQEAGL
jgi:hypothetical protein